MEDAACKIARVGRTCARNPGGWLKAAASREGLAPPSALAPCLSNSILVCRGWLRDNLPRLAKALPVSRPTYQSNSGKVQPRAEQAATDFQDLLFDRVGHRMTSFTGHLMCETNRALPD